MKRFLLVLALLVSAKVSATTYIGIAEGKGYPNEQPITVLGKNADVDASANETLNDNGGLLTFPTSANKINVVSANANDVGGVKAAGTLTVVDWEQMLNAKATGTVEMKATNLMTPAKATAGIQIGNIAQLDNATVSVNGDVLTEGVDWNAVNGEVEAATNLATAIDGLGNGISAAATNELVTLTYDSNGTAGNSKAISVAEATLNGLTLVGTTANDTTLSGGRDALLLTVNGNGLTAGTDFAIGSLSGTAINFASAINTDNVLNGYLLASANSSVVTLTYTTNGEGGNAKTLVTNNSDAASVSGATFTGGEDLLTLTVNGVSFVAGSAFTPSTSNSVTAGNIVTALNANGTVSDEIIASNVDNLITLTALSEGTAGNSIATATDDTDSLTVAGANLTGGVADGNGANLLLVKCLDTNYLEVTETVVLSGTSTVDTVGDCLRLNSVEVSEAGSTGAAQGNLTITQNGSGLFLGKILADTNQANLGYYTVPASKSALLTDISGSIYSGSGTVNVITKSRNFGSVFKENRLDTITDNGDNSLPGAVNLPDKFPAKSDIQFEADSDTDNNSVNIKADFVLVD